jgi:hypothetical protein
MLYALIISFGGLNSGVWDLYFEDVVTYTTMEQCEIDRPKQLDYIKHIHPWVTYTKGVCVAQHSKE